MVLSICEFRERRRRKGLAILLGASVKLQLLVRRGTLRNSENKVRFGKLCVCYIN